MGYENPFLADFASIFYRVLKEKKFDLAKLEVIIFDEEPKVEDSFARSEVLDILYQLGEKLNALTIYTEQPQIFWEFAEQYNEETGLVTDIVPKREQKKVFVKNWSGDKKIILDFEHKGLCYGVTNHIEYGYIPIYKRPWQRGENLDIRVPFGYNIVIVKGKNTNDRRYVRDRFDEGFYREE